MLLTEPIERFYVDGKYTVEHWQVDDTSRGTDVNGEPYLNYDKASNVATMTFYISGAASAPWIETIRTNPAPVMEGDQYTLSITYDDKEKDPLMLITELYYERELIKTDMRENLVPGADGTYPAVVIEDLPEAESGQYTVVATVWDDTGTGLGEYRFTVVSEGKITGMVTHTPQWEINRKRYNLAKFGEEINWAYAFDDYKGLSEPRKRGTNVFWSGEKFLLNANVTGKPTSVTCQIEGTEFQTEMTSTGTVTAEKETIYEGALWEESMIRLWGSDAPEELHFIFTAEYRGGKTKTYDAYVIVDDSDPYWRIHRLF